MAADLLVRLLHPSAAGWPTWAADDDRWYNLGMTPSLSGVAVTPDAAMRISAFFACLRVLAETMGYLPWFTYRRRRDGGRDRALNHPLYPLLHDQPNPSPTAL